jgi:hypothetical protein
MELHFSCINNDFNKNNTTHKCLYNFYSLNQCYKGYRVRVFKSIQSKYISECWGHIQIGHGKGTFTREALITFNNPKFAELNENILFSNTFHISGAFRNKTFKYCGKINF